MVNRVRRVSTASVEKPVFKAFRVKRVFVVRPVFREH
jgi:hypothetical protein